MNKTKCKCECHKPTMITSPSGIKKRVKSDMCTDCMENHKRNKYYQGLKAITKVMGV